MATLTGVDEVQAPSLNPTPKPPDPNQIPAPVDWVALAHQQVPQALAGPMGAPTPASGSIAAPTQEDLVAAKYGAKDYAPPDEDAVAAKHGGQNYVAPVPKDEDAIAAKYGAMDYDTPGPWASGFVPDPAAVSRRMAANPPGVAPPPITPDLQGAPKPTYHAYHGELIENIPPDKGAGMKEALGFGPGGYGASIPHSAPGAPWSEQINNGAIRALSQVLSPKAATEMLGMMVGGELVPAVANLPVIANYVKDIPTVLRALDVMSHAAVPAAAGAMGIKGIVEGGIPKNPEDATVAAVNALMAGLGVYGAIEAGRGVLAGYPQAPVSSTAGSKATAEFTPEQVGGIATIPPGQAAATAEALQQQGRRLTSEAWKQLSARTTDQAIPFKTNGGTVYLQPKQIVTVENGKRFWYESVTDATGKLLVGGSPDTVRTWLQQREAFVPTGESGTVVANGPGGMRVEPAPVSRVTSMGANTGAPAATTGAASPLEEPNVNQAEFIKAHNAWNAATNKAALDHIAKFGGTLEAAKAAVAGTVGLEPTIENYQAPIEPAPEPTPAEPVEPSKVERVSAATPNPPTAAAATQPESPETIALQMEQLGQGTRRVVMFPKGQGQPTAFPPNTGLTHDDFGNTYAYRIDLIGKSEVSSAAASNRLTEILGGPAGMGAPDKADLQGEPIAVVGRAPDGTEAQTTVTDAEHLADTHAATQAVTPPGGTVNIEPADHVVGERAGISDPNDPNVVADKVSLFKGGGFTNHGMANGRWLITGPNGQYWVKEIENGEALPWRPVPPAPAPRPVTPQVSPLGGVAPLGMPEPAAPPPITAAPTAAPKLPHALAGAKPRYNYQNKAFDLDFESDIDKAAVIAAQKNRSKHDQKYVDFVKDATGLTEAGVRAHGAKVKDLIKGMARDAEPGTLRVPTHSLTGLMTKSRAERKAAAEEKRNEVPGSADLGAENQRPEDSDQADRPQGAASNGDRPVPVREGVGTGGAAADAGGSQSDTGDQGAGVRRITGSANEPMTAEGNAQASQEAKTTTVAPYKFVWSGPGDRHKATANAFGGATETVPAFDGWARATMEGQPADAMKDQVGDLIRNPGKVPPGVSPFSGKPGMPYGDFATGMTSGVMNALRRLKGGERGLIVTSGGNLQVVDAWLKAGTPQQLPPEVLEQLAQKPYWSVTGKFFKLTPGGLEVVANNAEPGLYFTEHGETAFNQKAQTGVPSKREPTEPAELGTGSEGVQPGGGHPEALGGVPAENVPGPEEPGTTVQGGDVGGGVDGGHAPGDVEAGGSVRQGGGGGVPDVVPAPERDGPAQPHVQSVQPPHSGSDYRLTPEQAAAIESGGARTKARDNLEAIRTIKKILAEGGRQATLEEQAKLARYVGWGSSELANGIFNGRDPKWAGIREELKDLTTPEEFEAARVSTINAHYTRRDIAAAMWDALAKLGLKAGGAVGEPGTGIGNFFMMMPERLEGVRRTGIEMDLLTGAMAKALYPESTIIIKPYQDTNLPSNYFDAFIGNVPFQGGITIYDPEFKREPYLSRGLHNYFFAKSMTKLRPGGVMIMITSRGTLDNSSKAFRQWMAKEGELLGAVRLPRDTFAANAGTEVTTDIVVIRKRVPGQSATEQKWLESKPMSMSQGGEVDVNEYFHEHPEMMMGEMQPGTMYRKGYPELEGKFNLEHLRQLLDNLPSDMIPSWQSPATDPGRLADSYPDADYIKPGGYGFKDGVVVRNENGYLEPLPLKGVKLERAKGLIALRGAARQVLRTQMQDAPEGEYLAAREQLNKLYDAFVKSRGAVNSRANALTLGKDPDWPLLSSLEKWDKKTKTARKSDLFSARTNVKPQPITSVETGQEALAVSLNDYGRLDWDRMQQLTGRTPEELQKELAGRIYRNPVSKRWEPQDEYLSGNVRQKLEDAEFAAKQDASFAPNIEALKGVQPRMLEPGEIDAPLGATWIPAVYYGAFARDILKAEGMTVTAIPTLGSYATGEARRFADNGVANRTTYGNAYFDGVTLFEMALNGITPVARDEVEDFEGKTKSIKNPEATIEAVEKQQRLMKNFSEWLWRDPARAALLSEKYNRERNNLKLREFDGSHQTFPGLNRTWMSRNGKPGDLDPHQKNAVWRAVQTGNTLLAHAVGAGKTLEVIVSAMEMKRLGLMRKPMVAVPNHLVGQWRDEFMRAYPAAQILVPTKADFQAKNRKRLMSQIATGNYDAVIVGHKGFELLPVEESTFENFINEQLDEIDAALEEAKRGISDSEGKKNPVVKALARRKTSLQERLKRRTNRKEKDTTVTFEELGVDGLFVDEAHAYKNLGYLSMMDRIAGLPNTDANRAVDMLLKSRYVTGLHGGNRGLVFATGTPVSNSLAEIWTMMRYLMPQYLKKEGFDQFDAWAKTFGQKVTSMEVAPEGNRMMMRTRFSDFVNAPELMNMFRVVADVRTKDQLNLPTPGILTGKEIDVVSPSSRALKAYIGQLGERADAVRSGSVDPEDDNMLKISSDGRKASLDIRLVNPGAKGETDNKVSKSINNIASLYKEFAEHRATQLVFLDLSTPKAKKEKGAPKPGVANVDETPQPEHTGGVANTDEDEGDDNLDIYGEKEEEEEGEAETADETRERETVYAQIRNGLIARGIPANEIAFIHDADTDAKKEVLFAEMNSGDKRVLIGSTEKMGAGMNVQTRLLALHHLDAPWRPSDWEQRNGRIDRQGNKLWDDHQIPVRIFRYMTEGSFDAFMWQTIVSKARPITRFLNGDPSVRRVEEPAVSVLSAEQAMAISSGNPEVREKIILDQDIQRVEIMRGAWLTEQAKVNQELGVLPQRLQSQSDLVQGLNSDIATRNRHEGLLEVNGQEYRGPAVRKEGADSLIAVLRALGRIGTDTPIDALYRGFQLEAVPQADDMMIGEGDGRVFTREKAPDGNYLYSEAMNPKPKKIGGKGFLHEDLELRPLGKADAEMVHAEWTKPWTQKNAYEYHKIPILELPRLRLNAKAHSYPISVNYDAPAYTLSSADTYLRGFEEDYQAADAQIKRLERSKVELESKQGQPFGDADKLDGMLRRQRELAEKLGENKDDNQALAAAEEDDENPIGPLLKDPTSAMLPQWFPSRRMYVADPYTGQRTSQKVNVINKTLGVMKPLTKPTGRYLVVHLATGEVLRTLYGDDPVAAVAMARQAAGIPEMQTGESTPAEPRERAFSQFIDERYRAPTEKPEESVARLRPVKELEDAQQKAGPIGHYTSLKNKLAVPQISSYGDKGWAHVSLDGKSYSSDAKYIIRAEIQPVAKSEEGLMKPDTTAKLLAGKGGEVQVNPVAFSTDSIIPVKNKPSKEGRLVWFADGYVIDGRYYDDIMGRFPGATFLHDPAKPAGAMLINDSAGNRVGIVMGFKGKTPPASIRNIVTPPPKHVSETRPMGRRLEPEYMGMGLGAAQPYLEKAYEKDIKPGLKKIGSKLRGALDDLAKVLAPQTRGETGRYGSGVIREMNAELDQRRDRAVAALSAYRNHWRAKPVDHGFHGLDEYDAIETGRVMTLDPVDRAFADVARKLLNERANDALSQGLLHTYIENYMPHEYKNPDDAARWIQDWQSKRPMAGSEAYRKQRTYPRLKEALEDPDFTLVPKFDNPVDMVLAKLAQMDKSILAHRAFDEMNLNELHYVPDGGVPMKPPPGMAWIDDKIFTVYGPKYGAVKVNPAKLDPQPVKPFQRDFLTNGKLTPDGRKAWEAAVKQWQGDIQAWADENVLPGDVRVYGRRTMGAYAAPEPLARVINNHLSLGIGQSDAYQLYQGVNNFMNMLELSMSVYHGLTTTLNSAFSDIALGLQQLLEDRKPKAAVKSIVRGLTPFASAVHDAFPYFEGLGKPGLGTRIQYAWDHWDPAQGQGRVPIQTGAGPKFVDDPVTWAIVDALKAGGGKARQDSFYNTRFAQKAIDSLRDASVANHDVLGPLFRAVFNGALAIPETVMKPIMDYFVPRAKLGAFASLMQAELEKNPGMGRVELREVAGKIWDSMDNRFGQLSQKNLMMVRWSRELMNGLVGRPGWNLGAVKEISLGAVYDPIKNLADLAQGKKTRLSKRTYYVLGLLLGQAFLAGMLTYLLTGKEPHGADWVAFPDGGITEDGRPSRQILPTYVAKDIYSYITRPWATVKAKSAPALNVAFDVLENRDFNRYKIYGQDSIGIWKYIQNTFTPYSIQGLERNRERQQPILKQALPFLGIMPAGRRVGLSKAEQMITEYQDEHSESTRMPSSAHTQAKSAVLLAAKQGDLKKAGDLGRQAVAAGTMNQRDVQQSMARAKQAPLAVDYKNVKDLQEALRIYDAATPEERKLIERDARDKIFAARGKAWEWTPESRAIAQKYFKVPWVAQHGLGAVQPLQ